MVQTRHPDQDQRDQHHATPLATTQEWARRLGVHPRTVRRYADTGQLDGGKRAAALKPAGKYAGLLAVRDKPGQWWRITRLPVEEPEPEPPPPPSEADVRRIARAIAREEALRVLYQAIGRELAAATEGAA